MPPAPAPADILADPNRIYDETSIESYQDILAMEPGAGFSYIKQCKWSSLRNKHAEELNPNNKTNLTDAEQDVLGKLATKFVSYKDTDTETITDNARMVGVLFGKSAGTVNEAYNKHKYPEQAAALLLRRRQYQQQQRELQRAPGQQQQQGGHSASLLQDEETPLAVINKGGGGGLDRQPAAQLNWLPTGDHWPNENGGCALELTGAKHHHHHLASSRHNNFTASSEAAAPVEAHHHHNNVASRHNNVTASLSRHNNVTESLEAAAPAEAHHHHHHHHVASRSRHNNVTANSEAAAPTEDHHHHNNVAPRHNNVTESLEATAPAEMRARCELLAAANKKLEKEKKELQEQNENLQQEKEDLRTEFNQMIQEHTAANDKHTQALLELEAEFHQEIHDLTAANDKHMQALMELKAKEANDKEEEEHRQTMCYLQAATRKDLLEYLESKSVSVPRVAKIYGERLDNASTDQRVVWLRYLAKCARQNNCIDLTEKLSATVDLRVRKYYAPHRTILSSLHCFSRTTTIIVSFCRSFDQAQGLSRLRPSSNRRLLGFCGQFCEVS